MRCVTLSITTVIDLTTVARRFKRYHYSTEQERNVLTLTEGRFKETIFIFSNGCLVLWNVSSSREQWFLKEIKQLVHNDSEVMVRDDFVYKETDAISMASHHRFPVDIITLDDTDNVELMLAISFGLAQSIKLNAYETSIKDVVSSSERLPQELASHGKISLSRRAILQKIGEIFIAKNSINLSRDKLGIPEFFWRYPNIERHYTMVEKFMDIQERTNWLNEKLDTLNDLLEILTSHLEYRQSYMIESVIVLLIFIEILVSFFHLGI